MKAFGQSLDAFGSEGGFCLAREADYGDDSETGREGGGGKWRGFPGPHASADFHFSDVPEERAHALAAQFGSLGGGQGSVAMPDPIGALGGDGVRESAGEERKEQEAE